MEEGGRQRVGRKDRRNRKVKILAQKGEPNTGLQVVILDMKYYQFTASVNVICLFIIRIVYSTG